MSRAALGLVVAVTAGVLSACGVGAPTTAQPTAPSPSATTRTTSATSTDHAVAAPGPRTRPLRSADLLVYTDHPLDPTAVAAIRHVPGISGVDQISLATVTIENKALTLAAVDPATYRLYTSVTSADFQVAWDRVASGEVAVASTLRRTLPVDADGYLHLGSSAEAPTLHVGAFAPQIANAVDLVVNRRWGDALGMIPDNALLISTGKTSPDVVQKRVERLAAGASVQRLDVVARTGIDPSVRQTAFVVGSVADAVGTYTYTVLGGGRIAPDPAWVAAHITTQPVPILGEVTCNRAIFPQLIAALEEVQARGLSDRIHPGEYAGCYNARFIAGTTTLSNHAFGLALDLNTPGNQRGTVGEIDRGVVAIFEKWGFTWGGTWHYTDPMHFEVNRLVDPR